MDERVLSAYGLDDKSCVVVPYGNGLINKTWKVDCNGNSYILQRINDKVFTEPFKIASNIKQLSDHLKKTHPEYFFVVPVNTKSGKQFLVHAEGYYRLLPFVHDSYTFDVVQTPELAFEAAKQFGRFTKMFSAFDATQLQDAIPEFHNLSLRYQQFEHAIKNGNISRIREAKETVAFIQNNKNILDVYQQLQTSLQFKKRVTHHDTKISNVLFDGEGKGICVIDLDTVMSGYFISDIGDMMRTYLSPVSEEEKDYSKIEVREEYFTAIMKGYLQEMGDELTKVEKSYFVYAGQFLIYMQAIRFVTDHLNDDIYYGAKYLGQNLIRANNQVVLLEKLMQKEAQFQKLLTES